MMMNHSKMIEGRKYRLIKYAKWIEELGIEKGAILTLEEPANDGCPLFTDEYGNRIYLPMSRVELVPDFRDLEVGQVVKVVGNYCFRNPHRVELGTEAVIDMVNHSDNRVRLATLDGKFIPDAWVMPEDIRLKDVTLAPSPEDIKVGQTVGVFSKRERAEVIRIEDEEVQ